MITVHLNQIPDEGLHIEGEENADILDFRDEFMAPAGPIRYALDVGISGSGLFATGTIEITFRMTCVRCLKEFDRTFHLPHFAMQTELPGPENIDLTPFIREDILLALPSHPHCDWDGKTECPGTQVKGFYESKKSSSQSS